MIDIRVILAGCCCRAVCCSKQQPFQELWADATLGLAHPATRPRHGPQNARHPTRHATGPLTSLPDVTDNKSLVVVTECHVGVESLHLQTTTSNLPPEVPGDFRLEKNRQNIHCVDNPVSSEVRAPTGSYIEG